MTVRTKKHKVFNPMVFIVTIHMMQFQRNILSLPFFESATFTSSFFNAFLY